jgi:D-alanine-D-alanine ligase
VSARSPRVAVVYNEPALPPDHPDAASEADVVAMATAVAAALKGRCRPLLLAAAPPLGLFTERLVEAAPDVVFNLVEAFGGRSSGATYGAAVFELLGIPYTGSPVEALAACVSKSRTKALMRGHGLPVTDSVVLEPGDPLPDLAWNGPAFVKPDSEDGSLGIDQGSVVERREDLAARVETLWRAYEGSVLIEPYLPGEEFNVGVVAWPEPKALPVARVAYVPRVGAWPILTYDAKWAEGSEEDFASLIECPAAIDEGLSTRLSEIAIKAFKAAGCRDYARVDLRLDSASEPMILEVNPNPDIGPSAGLARALKVDGVEYSAALEAIIRQALERGRSRSLADEPTGSRQG